MKLRKYKVEVRDYGGRVVEHQKFFTRKGAERTVERMNRAAKPFYTYTLLDN